MKGHATWLLIPLAVAGCVAGRQDTLTTSQTSQLRARAVEPAAAGVTVMERPGGLSVRWAEMVIPERPVTVPLAAPDSVHARQPVVQVRLNGGKPIPMVVDTGAPVTLLEAEAALDHRVQIIQPDLLRNYFRGLAGGEDTYFGMIQRMGIGPELAFRNTLTAIRTERYSRKLGGLITVLKWQSHSLGFSTLGNFAFLTLDYPARQMTFSHRDFFVEPSTAVACSPLALTNAQIRVPLILAGREFSALLDTGNDAALMVSSNIVAELGWAGLAARGKPEVFVGLGGEMTLRSFVAPEMQLGGTTFRDVRIVSGPPEFGVTLGSGFLHAYRVTLDLRRKQLWFEKSSP